MIKVDYTFYCYYITIIKQPDSCYYDYVTIRQTEHNRIVYSVMNGIYFNTGSYGLSIDHPINKNLIL